MITQIELLKYELLNSYENLKLIDKNNISFFLKLKKFWSSPQIRESRFDLIFLTCIQIKSRLGCYVDSYPLSGKCSKMRATVLSSAVDSDDLFHN